MLSLPAGGLLLSIVLVSLPDVELWGRVATWLVLASIAIYLVWGWWRHYMIVSDRGIATQRWRRSSFVAWEDVAALAVGYHQPMNGIARGWRLSLTMAPTRRPPDPYPLLLRQDDAHVIAAFARRAGVPKATTPPWRDRWGNWHGPMFERDPREAIRSVHEGYVGPWRVKVRRAEGGYQALIEMTVGHVTVREGEVRPTLREATDDGSRFVADAQATLADGGGIASD